MRPSGRNDGATHSLEIPSVPIPTNCACFSHRLRHREIEHGTHIAA
mgnify:CR=1 FL=1